MRVITKSVTKLTSASSTAQTKACTSPPIPDYPRRLPLPGAGVLLRRRGTRAAKSGRQISAGHARGGARQGRAPAGARAGLHRPWRVGTRRAARLGRARVRRWSALWSTRCWYVVLAC